MVWWEVEIDCVEVSVAVELIRVKLGTYNANKKPPA